jgi:hypothetical protein
MTMKLNTILFAVGALASHPLLSSERGPSQAFEVTSTQRIDFEAGGVIEVNGTSGYLTVDGWDLPAVEITVVKSTKRFYQPGQEQDVQHRFEDVRVIAERRSSGELVINAIRPSHSGPHVPVLTGDPEDGVSLDCHISAPRNSRLRIRHGTGYVWISEMTADIQAASRSGDMSVILKGPGVYAVDARTKLGNIVSDMTGAENHHTLLGTAFTHAGERDGPQIHLRMGHGSIAIKELPVGPTPPNRVTTPSEVAAR